MWKEGDVEAEEHLCGFEALQGYGLRKGQSGPFHLLGARPPWL